MTGARLVAGAVVALLVAGVAQAHSPYLLPNTFDATGRDHVTVQASFTEHFFAPDVVMKSDDFHSVGPDGARAPMTPTYFKDLAVFEAPTPADGTWRITSGSRGGRMNKVVQKDGQWVFVKPGETPPAGAADMQSVTTAEVYVSRGSPNALALAPQGTGLEFQAVTHPNSIMVGQDARFLLLFDGKPLAGKQIAVHRADDDAESDKPIEVISDAEGRFAIKVAQPGVFHAMARHRISPAGGQPGRSLTYALTFEAVE